MTSIVKHLIGDNVRVRPRFLLQEWANLDDTGQLVRRNPGLLDFLAADQQHLNRVAEDIRRSLRRAWGAKKPQHREWYLFTARWQYEQARWEPVWGAAAKHLFPAAPRNDPFHRAIFDLVDAGAIGKLSKCRFNECPTPYFIRRRQKKQPYCSTACHGHALREIKRHWWRKNRAKSKSST